VSAGRRKSAGRRSKVCISMYEYVYEYEWCISKYVYVYKCGVSKIQSSFI